MRIVSLQAMMLLASCHPMPKELTAAQIAVLKSEGFQPKSDGWELGLSSKVLFDTDASDIKQETGKSIARTGDALKAVDITRVRVEGHTNSTGSDAHNDLLSQRRAQAVAQALGSSGLAGGHIEVKGLGKRDPVADNATEAGRAENRRVAIIVPTLQD